MVGVNRCIYRAKALLFAASFMLLLGFCQMALASKEYTEGQNAAASLNQSDIAGFFSSSETNPLKDGLDNLNRANSEQGNSGSGYFGKQTTSDLVNRAKQNSSGTGLTDYLTGQSSVLTREGEQVDGGSQRSFRDATDTDMSISEGVQHAIASQEAIPVANSKGEIYAAFKEALAIEKGEKKVEFVDVGRSDSLKKQEFEEVYEDVIEEEPYQMQCSETLISPTQEAIQTYNIKTAEGSTKTKDISVKLNMTLGARRGQQSPSLPGPGLMMGGSGHYPYLQYCDFKVSLETGAITRGRMCPAKWGYFFPSGKVSPRLDFKATKVELLSTKTPGGRILTKPITITPSAENHYVFSASVAPKYNKPGMFNQGYNPRQNLPLTYDFRATYVIPPIITKEGWQGAERLQELEEMGACKKIKETCLEGPSTKQFGSSPPYLKVHRDCWKRKVQYSCQVPQGLDDCGDVPGNCVEQEENIIYFFDSPAVKEKTFQCLRKVKKQSLIASHFFSKGIGHVFGKV